MYRLMVVVLGGLLIGCGDPAESLEPTWFDGPMDSLPEQISEFGVWDGAAEREGSPIVGYAPSYPLWTSGAEKTRWAWVPEPIEVSGGRHLEAPEGSVFFKTFSWEGEPVETRVMRRGADDWEFVSYLWDAEGRDATKLEMRRSTPVEVTWRGTTFEHRVPNENDCRKCHEPTKGMLLGFNALQLGGEEELVDRGVVSEPLEPVAIEARDEAEQAVLEGFVGNCVGCHNGGEHDQASFDLWPDVAVEKTVGVSTMSSASASGTRVVPGRPEESILYLAISGESEDREIKEMPPLGVELRDEAWIEQVRSWIEGLE